MPVFGAATGKGRARSSRVARRTAEIDTLLRALGFRHGAVQRAFLFESLCLAFLGGAVGLALASTLQAITVSTMSWQTFSELAFRFTLTVDIVAESLVFALAMGSLGGLLPTLRGAPRHRRGPALGLDEGEEIEIAVEDRLLETGEVNLF